MQKRFRNSGYSLMELMAAASVLAAIVSVILPIVSNFFSSQRASAEAKIFLADLRFARYEAIRTGQTYRMLLSNLPTSNSYQVQVLDLDIESNFTLADFNNNANWNSVLDEESRILSPDVIITASRFSTLYFTPQGRIAENWVLGGELVPMLPNQINFNYGNATMSLTVTSMGGISSTEFYEE